MQKQIQYIIKGMQKDLSISKSSNEFSFDNYNIRINPNAYNGLLSITNERGTKKIALTHEEDPNYKPIQKVILGHQTVNSKEFVIFSTGDYDCIHLIHLDFEDSVFTEKTLFYGNLGFDTNHPIESIFSFENEDIQKVYWVDGANQTRVINIVTDSINGGTELYTGFDFASTLSLNEDIIIEKLESGGNFPSGVIQYFITYYNRFGQESSIIYVSDLFYTSYPNRGGSAEDEVSCSFRISVTGEDLSKFDYVRIYSILRTSINATPTAKIVADIPTGDSSTSISYVDNGTTGSIIDPTELLYKAKDIIIPYTLCQKDNTLFLGNYSIDNKPLSEIALSGTYSDLKSYMRSLDVTFEYPPLRNNPVIGYYDYDSQLTMSSSQIKRFKYGETYRFGIQFQHKTGKWSEALFIKDEANDKKIKHYKGTAAGVSNPINIQGPAIPEVTIDNSEALTKLKELGYIKARGVIVCPTINDRTILCQGIVCPTVYNVMDRYTNSPSVVSSWFARPKISSYFDSYTDSYLNNDVNIDKGAWLEYKHDCSLPDSTERNAEIQMTTSPPNVPSHTGSELSKQEWVNKYSDIFFVDESVVTFHSPEIEMDTQIQNIDTSNLKFRVVGKADLTANSSYINITTATDTFRPFTQGFYRENIGTSNIDREAFRGLVSGVFFFDDLYNSSENVDVGFAVYPWHRNGSLNNQDVPTDSSTRTAMLDKKKMSNLRYSAYTYYIDNPWEPKSTISNVEIFNSNEISNISLNTSLGTINYYGNVNKILTWPDVKNDKQSGTIGYPIVTTYDANNKQASLHTKFLGTYKPLTEVPTSTKTGIDPINIKYKSSPHAVFSFGTYSESNSTILELLPVIEDVNISNTLSGYTPIYWSLSNSYNAKNECIWVQDPTFNDKTGYFIVGELYRDNVQNRFGGDTEEAILNNQWIPSGDPVDIPDSGSITITYKEGDTYYQRYDCLKTYPFTMEDQNSIVDIVSFMCETRINIDGRYDRNRGLIDNTTMSPTNFNLLNTVYSQENNFFTYRSLNYNKYTTSNFNNSILWSQPKASGGDIDLWTSINVVSTMDMDGDKGKVSALRKFNNEILCFQDSGISKVLFNSRVQIPASDGVPIEISNSMKVDGKVYISNTIGALNKWSIQETPNGIYFIDNLSTNIYLFNNGFKSLSIDLGFTEWIMNNNSMDIWNPVDYNNFITYYDRNNNDVYFVNKEYCLCYSEVLGQFTSFYSYNRSPLMINTSDRFVSLYKNSDNTSNEIWENNAGDYNYFYGNYRGYYITYRINPDGVSDKVFNTLEFRADTWDEYNKLRNNTTFDVLMTQTEYQTGTVNLINTPGKPSPLKKKFRIWRANIPRDDFNNRDRMRNPWLYLTLECSNNNINKYRTELHNIIVKYFE